MAHGTVAEREATTSIPALIKRNTLLLALSQALTGAGMGVPYSIGPLVVVALTGTAGLSGLAISLLGISRFMVAYPLGRIADTYGRKPALQLGMALGLTGTVLIGLAVLGRAFGLNDTLTSIANTVIPLIVGPLVEAAGLASAGVLAMAMMVAPIFLLLTLQEPSPGTYTRAPATGKQA
jgi:MFS family permease